MATPPSSVEAPAASCHAPLLQPTLSLPSSAAEWAIANEYLKCTLVPKVLAEPSIERKTNILSSGLYKYFSESFGCVPPQKHNPTSNRKSQHNRSLKKLRALKNEVRREFRAAKRNDFPPDEILSLAHKYHTLIREHNKARKQSLNKQISGDTKHQKKLYTRNPYKFSQKLFSDTDDSRPPTRPTFSEESSTSVFL